MHISPDDQCFSKIRPELQNGVPLVDLHELKRLQKLEGSFADWLGFLRKRLLQIVWDIRKVVRHAVRTSLSVHAVVAVLQARSGLVHGLPRQVTHQPVRDVALVHFVAAAALVCNQFQAPGAIFFLFHELLKLFGCVQVILKIEVKAVKVDHI